MSFVPAHGQSDNLAVLGVVDTSVAALPTHAALRWAFRYALGFPDRIEVWVRPHESALHTAVHLRSGVPIDDVVARIRGDAIRTASGLQIRGGCTIEFARPIFAVGFVVEAGQTAPSHIRVTARHQPAVVDAFPSARHPRTPIPHGTASWFWLLGDCIDALTVELNRTLVVRELAVTTLLQELSGTPSSIKGPSAFWSLIGSANLDPAGTAATTHTGIVRNPAPGGPVHSALEHLFSSTPGTPMATRSVPTTASATGTTLSVPELGTVLLSATEPARARELNLLFDITTSGHEVSGQNDYAVVARWPNAPSSPISAARTLDFSASRGRRR